jgi:hypothetical protein
MQIYKNAHTCAFAHMHIPHTPRYHRYGHRGLYRGVIYSLLVTLVSYLFNLFTLFTLLLQSRNQMYPRPIITMCAATMCIKNLHEVSFSLVSVCFTMARRRMHIDEILSFLDISNEKCQIFVLIIMITL